MFQYLKLNQVIWFEPGTELNLPGFSSGCGWWSLRQDSPVAPVSEHCFLRRQPGDILLIGLLSYCTFLVCKVVVMLLLQNIMRCCQGLKLDAAITLDDFCSCTWQPFLGCGEARSVTEAKRGGEKVGVCFLLDYETKKFALVQSAGDLRHGLHRLFHRVLTRST